MNQLSNIAETPFELFELLLIEPREAPCEGKKYKFSDYEFVIREGLLRQLDISSDDQEQTANVFGYLWRQIKNAEYDAADPIYGGRDQIRLDDLFPGRHKLLKKIFQSNPSPRILDAGCGNAKSGMLFFEKYLKKIKYLAVDISNSVEIAQDQLNVKEVSNICIQCDLLKIPIKKSSIDILFCPHVLQHTDNVDNSVKALFEYLRPGGLAFLYCTKPGPPIRELSDEYIRKKLAKMSPDKVFQQVSSLTKLGRSLKNIDSQLIVEDDIDAIGLKAGSYSLQTFIFDYLLRAYFRPELPFDINNVFNLDWFGPINYHGICAEQFEQTCRSSGFTILKHLEQFGSSTIIATK